MESALLEGDGSWMSWWCWAALGEMWAHIVSLRGSKHCAGSVAASHCAMAAAFLLMCLEQGQSDFCCGSEHSQQWCCCVFWDCCGLTLVRSWTPHSCLLTPSPTSK